MLIVNIEHWLELLRTVNWNFPSRNVNLITQQLMELVPTKLSKRIERAVKKADKTSDQLSIMVVLDGNRETGEQLVFEISFGPFWSPAHSHLQSADVDYGEMIWTLAGAISDTTDDGKLFWHTNRSLSPIVHGPGTEHITYVDYWIGVFYQPAGSTLVTANA